MKFTGLINIYWDQCFSLKFNNREDEFGPSSLEDRMRLPMEIVHAIKQRDSISLPISYQFSIHEKLEDGFNSDELQQLIKMLEKMGSISFILCLHISSSSGFR